MSDVTPFQLIDSGVDQRRPDALSEVPVYGIVNSNAWSRLSRSNDHYLVEPATGQPALLRMACKESGVWSLIESQPSGNALIVSQAAGARIEQGRPDCVTEDAAGAVVNVSPPWAAADLNGLFAFAVILVPFLAWLAARFLLSRFERSVKRGQGVGTRSEAAPWPSASEPVATTLRARELQPEERSRCLDIARAFRRRRIALYTLVAVSSAFILAHAWVSGSDAPWSFNRHVGLTIMLAWPLVPTVASLLVARRPFMRALVAYGLVASAAAVWFGASSLVILAISASNALGTATLFIPRTRAAQPWLLLPAMFGSFGVLALLAALQSQDIQRLLAQVAHATGVSAVTTLLITASCWLMMLAVASLVFARSVVWLVQKLRLSSTLLGFVSFWLLNVLALSSLIGARDDDMLHQAELGMLPVVLALATAIILTAGKRAAAARVLYLRAFNEGAKNTSLVARIEKRLSGVANVDLIAGPDLASVLAEPEELLDFIARKGSRKYFMDVAAFEAARKGRPDRLYADGSHPIRHYFCAASVWFDVFRRLARDCDAVIMDARALKTDGVRRELVEVVHRVPLQRVVLLVSNESRGLVQGLLEYAWHSLPADSPNRGAHDPQVCVIDADHGNAFDVLEAHVCQLLDATVGKSTTAKPEPTARAA